jgi:hypothetical protein
MGRSPIAALLPMLLLVLGGVLCLTALGIRGSPLSLATHSALTRPSLLAGRMVGPTPLAAPATATALRVSRRPVDTTAAPGTTSTDIHALRWRLGSLAVGGLLGMLAGLLGTQRPAAAGAHWYEALSLLATTGAGHGHGHGHGGPPADPNSFVQTALRQAAMKLHTRDQSREGEQTAQKPVTQWEPTHQQLLQFLVDSKAVHEALGRCVDGQPSLAALRHTGLERVAALDRDIEALSKTHPTLRPTTPSAKVVEYASDLERMAREDVPGFVCHFYNTHFAHTAGGMMIGRSLSNKLLDGKTMHFYEWDGDVKVLLASVRGTIDDLATRWSLEEKERCVGQTAAAFQGGGLVLQSLKV